MARQNLIKLSDKNNEVDDTVDEIISIVANKYSSEGDVIWNSMEAIRYVAFGETGRASLFLANFLANKAKEIKFDLASLFAEDKSVRNSVEHDLWKRLSSGSNPAYSCMKPLTIIQPNYANDDWWRALGTYFIYVSGPYSEFNGTMTMILKGNDLYQWYPKEERPTQIIHRIGSRLVELGRAANFDMVTDKYNYVLDRNRVQQLKSLKPEEYNPRHSWRFGPAAYARFRMWKLKN